MGNKIGQINIDRNLLNFLYGVESDVLSDPSEQGNVAVGTGNKQLTPSGVKDQQSLELLRYEFDLLYDDFFTKTKVCQSLSELLKEIESPNETSDLAELKSLVYSELKWLERGNRELFSGKHEEEMKWLKELVTKTIGAKGRTPKNT